LSLANAGGGVKFLRSDGRSGPLQAPIAALPPNSAALLSQPRSRIKCADLCGLPAENAIARRYRIKRWKPVV